MRNYLHSLDCEEVEEKVLLVTPGAPVICNGKSGCVTHFNAQPRSHYFSDYYNDIQ